MIPILGFLHEVIVALLQLSIVLVLVYAVLSWLVAFNVVNMRNRAVYQITTALERVCRTLLSPFTRFIPNFGGLDISPVLYVIVVSAAIRWLIDPLFNYLIGAFGGATYSV